ncbi:FAD-dependent thymidylate synthase [Lyticum sinuosum]|uniref:Flavin-dependent thymidylate synthase n=1 Tax=Lyticum sinuosum TaxID=1332059 RepID=A0AAE4VLC3_9RICK|nr:FAD-dependent thymidylate synthase [Lyticum sinuosum]MDZ5761332.1 FAD-dependent thymidylate synthase [Lyticum sinuosum]
MTNNQDNSTFSTKRSTVQEIEAIINQTIPILDHGFIRIIDYMGDDNAIVQSARVSYGKGTTQINADKALISYLMRHHHTSPFEMCEIKFHIKAPIFVARQWLRHRTANVNEYSARYSILDREFYLPSKENISSQSTNNKQCRVSNSNLKEEEIEFVIDILKNDANRCYDNYLQLMNINENTTEKIDPNKSGIARELSRMNLNLNYYTQWYWKIDLHNLLHFLYLRTHNHAQYEIRIYAQKILEIVQKWVPHTYEAFINYRLESKSFSKNALNFIKKQIKGEDITFSESGISKREWNDICEYFNLEDIIIK